MKRRKFLKWTVASSLTPMLAGCGDGKNSASKSSDKQPSGRTTLEKIPGVISIHEHIDSERAAQNLLEAMEKAGIAKMNLLGCYESLLHGKRNANFESSTRNNDLLMRVVKRYPDKFTAFVLVSGLGPDPVAVLKSYLKQGASGVKMYNGAGNKYRAMPMTDSRLVPLYRFCELHGVPVLIHVDPIHLDEYLGVVRDYPSIPWICPHLFVQTSPKNVDRLPQILRKYPNIYTDMSFGFEGWMHANLMQMSKSAQKLRETFVAHADQILYGTDVVYALNSPHRTVDWAANSFMEYRKFLEFDFFHHKVKTNNKTFEGDVKGLGLPRDVLQKIYVENPKRILDRPKIVTDEDDLHTVFRELPNGATFSKDGPYALLSVAAVHALSNRTTLDGLKIDGASLATTPDLVSSVATVFSIAEESIDTFSTAEALVAHITDAIDVIGILPLGALTPGIKTLSINGANVTEPQIHRCAAQRQADKNTYFEEYPLLFPFSASDTPSLADYRFDPHEIRTVMLTGGSLFGRGMLETAAVSPKEVVSGVSAQTQRADVMHLSIENVIRNGCVQDLKRWRFCYNPIWLNALDYLGADVIELTGNHLPDFGDQSVEQTLQAYRRYRYPYFGGGRDLPDALKPAILRIRGLNIGFFGINHLNPVNAVAANHKPGPLSAVHFDTVLKDIAAKSDIFFCTYQGGYEFSPFPWNDMLRYAHKAVDGGAVGVVGTHPHMPTGAEAYDGALVVYGLGNFLFRHPPTVIPRRNESEYAVVAKYTLYGKTLLQAEVLPIRQTNGALSWATNDTRHQILDRVRQASNKTLAPRIPMSTYTDANVELNTNQGVHGMFDVQRKLGLSGILFSLPEKLAQGLGSADEMLTILTRVVTEQNFMKAPGIKFAFPLLPNRDLPDGAFDAVRIFENGDMAALTTCFEIALVSGRPIQLKCKNNTFLEGLPNLLKKSGSIPIILSGLALFSGSVTALNKMMTAYPHLYLDTSAQTEVDFSRYFSMLEETPDNLAAFVTKHQDRILLATGTSSNKKRLGWNAQPRLLRALHESLLYDSFRLPDIRRGDWAEWNGYPYVKETTKPGLKLGKEVVEKIAGGNFHTIFQS